MGDPNAKSGSPHPLEPSLAVDTRVAGRYRIVRFLARGGMGEVYEAEDLELGVHIALKTLRTLAGSDGSSESRAIDRFKREVQLARRVTHPNVCRIFDLGVDQSGETRIVFLTMELVDGESLGDRLDRGALAPAEALPLLAQMADALAAAHAAGVIHRDFKSSNVMVVDGGKRVVVTDFGLARPSERNDDSSLSQENALIGSPKYMAPEQVEGLTLTPAADVYALGVVAFEMVTGRVPFLGETALQTALKRLTEPAPSARSLRPELPASWDAALTRCLAKEPRDRFADPHAFVAALSADVPMPAPTRTPTPATRPAPHPTSTAPQTSAPSATAPAPPTRAPFAIAVLALVVTVGGAWWILHRRGGGPPATPMTTTTPASTNANSPRVRRAVAVVGFRNLSARAADAWLATAFAEMLSTELAAGEEIRTVESERVVRAKKDLALADADRYAPETLARLRRQLDVDWVVAGSYVVTGAPARLRLDVALQDAQTGDTIITLSDTAPSGELIDLVGRIGIKLREALGVGKHDPAAERQTRAALPADEEAARLYAEALVHRRAADTVVARDLLERAIARDPSFALAHSALGEIYLDLGASDKARAETERAYKLGANLPREERLLLEARYRKAQDDWDKAIEIYRALHTFFPDELSYGLSLARAQVSGGHSKDAIATIAELRKLPKPLSDDPWIDLNEARAWAKQGDWKRRLAADQRVIDKGAPTGQRLIVADAQTGAAEAYYYLGEPARARPLYEAAKRTYDELGDKKGAASCVSSLADMLLDGGNPTAARARYEEVLAFHRDNGYEFGQADILNRIAQTWQAEGKLQRALETFAQSLAHFTKINEREGIGNISNNSADVFMLEGEVAAAERGYRAAQVRYREVGMHTYDVAELTQIALAVRRQGRLAEAIAINGSAVEKLKPIGDKGRDLAWKVEDALEKREADDLAGAEAALAQAKGLVTDAVEGDQRSLRLLRAEVALDAGKIEHAVAEARAVADEAAAAGRASDEADARELYARALYAAHQPDAARAAKVEIGRALALTAKSELRDQRWRIETSAARITADCAAAAKTPPLQSVIAAATKAGAFDRRLEAELARAEVARDCGDKSAPAALAAVAAEARRAGFKRIARLAGR
jgi:eukaryotic-like serine/threonine-protein kinase